MRNMLNLEIFRQILIGIVCNLLVIDSGLHEGWSTPILPKFEQDDPLKVSSDKIVWVVNLMYVGVGLGSVVPFLLMDRIGRKGTLLCATVPKIASWILIGLAATVPQLYIGRILAGVGCGITYSVMPMYLGEVSSKRTRGPLGIARIVRNVHAHNGVYCDHIFHLDSNLPIRAGDRGKDLGGNTN